MKNRMEDVRNHLIMAMERLGDDELMKESGEKEIEKAKALSDLARSITEIENIEIAKTETAIHKQDVQLRAMEVANKMGYTYIPEEMKGNIKDNFLLGGARCMTH